MIAVGRGTCARQGKVRVGEQGRVDGAKRFSAAHAGKIGVVFLRDDGDVVPGFSEWRHAAVFDDAPRTRIVGGQRIDDVAVEARQLCRKIPRAAMHLQVGVVIVFRIAAEIAMASAQLEEQQFMDFTLEDLE